MVANVYMARTELLRQLIDPRRDINAECGYPAGSYINPSIYMEMYDREPVAARVVEILPKESWQIQPMVYESDDSAEITPFEQAWDDLGKSIRGEHSWYRQEEGNPVWEYLRRVDELSGIGQYGIILLGLSDNPDLSQPVKGVIEKGSAPIAPQPWDPSQQPDRSPNVSIRTNSEASAPAGPYSFYNLTINKELQDRAKAAGKLKLLYLRCFPEYLAQITQFESNPSSPRYGQPTMYAVTLNDPRVQSTGIGLNLATVNVHWTRVIHIADLSHQASPSEVLAIPRMRPVLNRILDLRKLYSGSAEMYWKGAFPGMVLETHPQLGGDVNIDHTRLRSMMEEFTNGLQRYMSLMGMSARTLSPQVVDPTSQIQVHLEAICIKLGIPKRIFMGSERGELASSQDDGQWNDRIKERQSGYITPRIIIPFIDRLIMLGILPTPDKAKPKQSESTMNPRMGSAPPTPVPGQTQADPNAQPGGGNPLEALLKGGNKPAAKPGEPAPADGEDEDIDSLLSQFGEEPDTTEDANATGSDDEEQGDGEGIDATDRSNAKPSSSDREPVMDPSQEEGEPGNEEEQQEGEQPPEETGDRDATGNPVPSKIGGKPMDPDQPPGKDQSAMDPMAKLAKGKVPVQAGGGGGGVLPGAAAPGANPLDSLLKGQTPEGKPLTVPAPKGYVVEWPDVNTSTDMEKVQVATQRIAALAQYVSGQLEMFITPMDLFTTMLGMDEEEARSILENASKAEQHRKADEQMQKQQQMMEQQDAIDKGLAPDPSDPKVIEAQAAGAPPNPFGQKPPFGGPPGGGKPPFGKGGPPGKPPFGKKPFPPGPTGNYDPDQPRDKDGKWSDSGSHEEARHKALSEVWKEREPGFMGALKATKASASMIEHVAIEWAKEKVENTIDKSPAILHEGLQAAFWLGKVATRAAFSTWTVAHNMAERIAKERGFSADKARQLKATLQGFDIATTKPVMVAGEVASLAAPALAAISMVPPATAAYLMYSGARHPVATAKAARKATKEVVDKATYVPYKGANASNPKYAGLQVEKLTRNDNQTNKDVEPETESNLSSEEAQQ